MSEEIVVHISGLSFNVNENHLKEIFSKCAKVSDSKIAKNEFGQSLGWGLVYFTGLENASEPISFMNGGQIDGCVVTVREADLEKDKIE